MGSVVAKALRADLLAPALGISLYEWQHDLPFIAFALLLLALSALSQRLLPN